MWLPGPGKMFDKDLYIIPPGVKSGIALILFGSVYYSYHSIVQFNANT